MTVDIVIVNWNSGDQLRECLASVRETTPLELLGRVVVVDNASTDDSLDGLDELGLPLGVLRNGENRGFGAACNQGAARGRAPYLLFLNPDVRLYPDSLAAAAAWLQEHEVEGFAIAGIQLVDESGDVQRTCARIPSVGNIMAGMVGLDRLLPERFPGVIMTEWSHEASGVVDHVIGAFMLIRRSLFEQVGGFDERFFVYLEDLDLSQRVAMAGGRSYYLSSARAFHKGGGTSEQVKARRLFYSTRSRIVYVYKHHGRVWGGAVALGSLLVELPIRLGWAAARRDGRSLVESLGGFALLCRDWRALLGLRGR
jgi:N-acetylglucosaminyl-diphospho-decaprenol L-rhamnosyltransferase